MKDGKSETGEMNDEDLNAVTGGSVVDTVVGLAQNAWKIITSPPRSGVKGESLDQNHKDY